MGLLADLDIPVVGAAAGEIERNPWENLIVSLERNTYKILGNVASVTKRISGVTEEGTGARMGLGWLGKASIKAEDFWDGREHMERLHPETDPELMDKFAELLGTSVPLLIASAGGGAVGGVAATGTAIASATTGATVGSALTAFGIMKEDAYKSAISSGATEKEALLEGNIVGGINALLTVAQLGNIFRATKSGTVLGKALISSIRSKTYQKVAEAGGKFTMNMVRTAATEGLEEALQGTTEDVVPFLLRGKEIEEGFAQRRAGEFAAGAVMGGLFGVLGTMAKVSYDAGKGRVITVPEIENMQIDDTTMPVVRADTSLAENPEAAGAQPKAAELSPELTQVADAAQDGQELDAGAEDMEIGRVLQPDEAIETATFRIVEVDSSGKRQVVGEFDSQSNAQAYRDTLSESMGKPAGATYDLVGPTTAVTTTKATAEKQAVQNIIRRRLNEDASAKDRLRYSMRDVDVKGIRKATATEMSIEKGKRFAESENIRQEILKSTGDPDYAIAAAQKELGGEYSKARFIPSAESALTDADWRDLKVEIHNSDLQTGEKINAYHAIEKLRDGIIPPPYEAKMLERALGMPGFLNEIVAVGQRKSRPATSALLELINFPRTLLAGIGDNSMPGRQGITILFKHPKIWWKNNVAGYRAMMDLSGDWTQAKMNDILTSRYSDKPGFMRMLTDINGTMQNMEESYLSNVAKNIPFFGALVRAGQRASTMSMNGMRADFYTKIAEQWEGMGKSDQDYEDLAQLANDLTGRGHGQTLARLGPWLNAGFFAPRFTVSRFQLVGDLALTTPAVRKIAASELASFLAGGLTIMGMASLLGAKVEKDPRSSDFGKIKIGKTRIDMWAGYTQIARLLAGELTGEGKSIRTGEIYKRNRLEIMGRYIQSKLSPGASLGVEILSGKDYMGEPIPDRVRTPEGAIKYALEKVTPLVLQDTLDALRYEGIGQAAWTMPLAFQGIGVQTYEPRPLDFLTDARNHYASKVFQSKWDDLGPTAQKLLVAQFPQIDELANRVKMERMDIGKTLQEQQDSGWRVQRSLPKNVQKELESANFFVGGLSRRLNRDWKLNQTLYKKYEQDVSKMLNLLLPELVSAPWWDSLGTAEKNYVLAEYTDKVKAAIRQMMVATADIKDMERFGQ